jgi:hypothetical protein
VFQLLFVSVLSGASLGFLFHHRERGRHEEDVADLRVMRLVKTAEGGADRRPRVKVYQ